MRDFDGGFVFGGVWKEGEEVPEETKVSWR